MDTETVKLTIRLPRSDVVFAKSYAKAHGLTVTEMINRYLRRTRTLEQRSPAPELDTIIGLIPPGANVEEEYQRHLLEKHTR